MDEKMGALEKRFLSVNHPETLQCMDGYPNYLSKVNGGAEVAGAQTEVAEGKKGAQQSQRTAGSRKRRSPLMSNQSTPRPVVRLDRHYELLVPPAQSLPDSSSNDLENELGSPSDDFSPRSTLRLPGKAYLHAQKFAPSFASALEDCESWKLNGGVAALQAAFNHEDAIHALKPQQEIHLMLSCELLDSVAPDGGYSPVLRALGQVAAPFPLIVRTPVQVFTVHNNLINAVDPKKFYGNETIPSNGANQTLDADSRGPGLDQRGEPSFCTTRDGPAAAPSDKGKFALPKEPPAKPSGEGSTPLDKTDEAQDSDRSVAGMGSEPSADIPKSPATALSDSEASASSGAIRLEPRAAPTEPALKHEPGPREGAVPMVQLDLLKFNFIVQVTLTHPDIEKSDWCQTMVVKGNLKSWVS